MKQVLYVSTSVLALALVMAFYYYLRNGNQPQPTKTLVQTPKATISQPCNCDLSFLNGSIFGAPAVQPPLRADAMPSLPPYQYAGIDTRHPLPTIRKNPTQKEVIAWHSDNKTIASVERR